MTGAMLGFIVGFVSASFCCIVGFALFGDDREDKDGKEG